MPIDALSVLCEQLTLDLLAIAKFLLAILSEMFIQIGYFKSYARNISWFFFLNTVYGKQNLIRFSNDDLRNRSMKNKAVENFLVLLHMGVEWMNVVY